MPAFDDELLSAYLDGELNAADRARVERALAEQPESRQLLEELRSLKTSLERMPRARLPHDFAEQVLRQAEKEMLTAPGEMPAVGPAASDVAAEQKPIASTVHADGDEQPGVWSWQRMRRRVIWTTLTLAAGLLIMIVDRGRTPPAGQRQVAQAPAAAREHGDGQIGAPAEDEAEQLVAEQAPHGETDAMLGGMPRSSAGGRAAGASPDFPPPPMPSNRAARGLGAEKRDALGRTAQEDEVMDEPADMARTRVLRDHEADSAPNQDSRESISPDQTLVVWCVVAPDTKYNERFRELLLSNSIQWDEQEEAAEREATTLDAAVRGEEDSEKAEQPKPPSAGKPTNRPSGGAEGAMSSRFAEAQNFGAILQQRAGRRNNDRLAQAQEAALDANAELVVVEASEPQIEAVLEELDRDDDVFKSVDVEPAADAPRQQSFGRYRRLASDFDEVSKDRAGRNLKRPSERLKEEMRQQQAGGQKTAALSKQNSPASGTPDADGMKSAAQNAIGGYAYKLRAGANQSPAPEQAANTAQDKKLNELKRSSAMGDENRLQVLFVLSPLDDAKPAAAAAPVEARPAKPAEPKSTPDD
ncbi:MAG TPA: zf-HC2 domain-containing protein [Pirellulales bacterium]|nr:zf-HC2 domain-containing protein [Pirellulales bacterium]